MYSPIIALSLDRSVWAGIDTLVCAVLFVHFACNGLFSLSPAVKTMRSFCTMHCLPSCGLLDAGFAAVVYLLTFLLSCLQTHSLTYRLACERVIDLLTRLQNCSDKKQATAAGRICLAHMLRTRSILFGFFGQPLPSKSKQRFSEFECALPCLIRPYTTYTNEYIC